MRRWGAVGSLMACLALVGCGLSSSGSWTPDPIVTVSASPATAPNSASATPTSTAAALRVPDASGAIDVHSTNGAHFASPTGRIWCALSDEWALCHFPRGMDSSRVPPSSTVCPGAELDVTGVSVIDAADYFCSGGAEALPQTDGEYVAWWKTTGFPSVKYDGQRLAVLPYGRTLVAGDFVCLSEKVGVTCGNIATGKGFRVALAGVTFIS